LSGWYYSGPTQSQVKAPIRESADGSSISRNQNSPEPPPKSITRVYEDRGGGIVLSTITTTPASGAANVLFVLYKIDGKEYPQVPRGADTTNTVTQRLVDAHTVEGITKRDGKVVSGFTQVVSADGKTLTYTPKDAQGQPTGTQVFEKQGGTT
jgi:hypothetical protein